MLNRQMIKSSLLVLLGVILLTSTSNAHAAILYGDVDGSGRIDIVDALMTAQSYVGQDVPGFLSEAADVNCDEVINIVDALMIAQHFVGLNELPDCHLDEWGFFIYLNADNNLHYAGDDDLVEMTSGGSTDDVKIVSLFDTYSNVDDDTGKLIYITSDGYDVIDDWGETDMGDWNTLARFGKWAVETYPAKHYALILWDHGDGWRDGGTDNDPLVKGFSHDSTNGDSTISVANGDYARALSEITETLGRKLDLIGFDACLMGMWEVAVASAPYADYLVASEETESNSGWSYEGFMPALVENPTMTPVELGESIIDAYDNAFGRTLAMIDLNAMDELSESIDHLAGAMMDGDHFHRIFCHRIDTLEFYSKMTKTYSIDIKDFSTFLEQDPTLPEEIRARAADVIASIDDVVLYNKSNQTHYENAHGLAIYFPRSGYLAEDYTDEGAIWSETTRWDEFLEAVDANSPYGQCME